MSDTRIVLVKPGDVLMLGNVELPEDAEAREAFGVAMRALKDTLELEHILVFADDIDLAVKPRRDTYSADSTAMQRYRDAITTVGRTV